MKRPTPCLPRGVPLCQLADPPSDLAPAHSYCHTQAASQLVYSVAAASAASAAASAAASSCSAGAADFGADGCFLECLEDIWERDTSTGFIEFCFDPETQVLRGSPSAPANNVWELGALLSLEGLGSAGPTRFSQVGFVTARMQYPVTH